MKVQIILINSFYDIVDETFKTLVEFDFSIFNKYDKYLKSKFHTSYHLSFNDYLLWDMYIKNINIDAELLCDKKAIRDRYEYFTTHKDIPDYSILDYFMDENNFKFNLNGMDYYVPAKNIINKDCYVKEYDVSNLYSWYSYSRYRYSINSKYKFKCPTMIIKI